MAAPHIAGVVALMQAAVVKTPAQVESKLKATARSLPGSCSGGCGTGIVDARAALDAQLGSPLANQDNLFNGQAITGLAGSKGSTKTYRITVPAGVSSLSFTLSGGSGDADLYVRFGSAPTTGSYDCRPYLSGNNETCTFTSPQAGTYHVMVRGYSSYSGATLQASY